MKSTYTGSCHCGSVSFECDLDLADGTSKCKEQQLGVSPATLRGGIC
jgi:hypothetical protein